MLRSLLRRLMQPRQGLCTMSGRSLDPRAAWLSHQWSNLTAPELPNTFCVQPAPKGLRK